MFFLTSFCVTRALIDYVSQKKQKKMLRCVTLEVEYDIYNNGIVFQTCLQVVPLNIPCLDHFDT